MSDTVERITQYLSKGGLFNPEMAMHERVSELLIDCREELLKEESVRRKLVATHIKSGELQERAEAAESKADALTKERDEALEGKKIMRKGGVIYQARALSAEDDVKQLEAKVDALMREKEELRAALVHLEQAYSNKHSPQHRQSALTEARALVREQPEGFRKCEFCGSVTNAKLRACCNQGRTADKDASLVREQQNTTQEQHDVD